MSLNGQAAADDGALSVDAFAASLEPAEAKDEEEKVASSTEGAGEGDVEEEPADAAEDEEDLHPEEPEGDEEEEGARLPPPASWAKEDHTAWGELTPAAQAVVARREADRDKAMAQAASKAGQAAAEVKTLSEGYEQVKGFMTNEVDRAKKAWVERWGNVDWVRAARELDPKEYNAYRVQADEEREQIAAYEAHLERVAEKAAKASKSAREAFLAEQSTKLAELSPELADPEKGKERRVKTAEYLVKQGFPAEVLADISAAELTIADKARMWDEAQEAAKKQASLPRKNPVSTAKPVPSGSSASAPTPQRNAQLANARLAKLGTIDAFVAALDADEAVRTRKARRA